MIKTPAFWYLHPKNFIVYLLLPFSYLYWLGYQMRQFFSSSYKSAEDIVIIAVGNVTTGGGGKTPTSLYLYHYLKANGFYPCILTKGYKGQLKGPLKIDVHEHSAELVGDESYMMSLSCDTFMSHSRLKGIQFIEAYNQLHMDQESFTPFNIVIMDDGYQNPTIHKDIHLLVFDAENPTGNGELLPAGPLRQTLKSGLDKSDYILSIYQKKPSNSVKFPTSKPVYNAHYEPSLHIDEIKQNHYIAFSGIARPDKFFNLLAHLNLHIEDKISFPDHVTYTSKNLKFLLARAEKSKAKLITTEKDMVKLRSFPESSNISILPISLKIDKEQEFGTGLLDQIKALLSLKHKSRN